ncbi:hypothetical protein [Microbacterium sp. JZ31]|uniref:hypothetical protein n=1 Tax=Microbacterium sp. JZ31 TaxID=1906274 RepID=UPI001933D8B7|nr:hypothetical protein [Microbacterium sp. JZ31]
MTPHAPLPDHLRGQAFRVADCGLSARRRRGTDLRRPAYGTRLPAEVTDLASDLRARALMLPEGAVYSHVTVALLTKVPLPLRLAEAPAIHVTTPFGTRARRGRGVVGHQRQLAPEDRMTWSDVRCTSRGRMFCDLADLLSTAELVAVGDHLLRRWGAGRMRREIAAAIERYPRRQRRPMLRAVLARLDHRAESPKESELRVLLQDHGFEGFEVNGVIRDDDGGFVARGDLVLRALRIDVEYEGDHHRSPAQWRRDLQRRRRLEALGWVYLSVTQADLDDPAALLADLRAAILSQRARLARI